MHLLLRTPVLWIQRVAGAIGRPEDQALTRAREGIGKVPNSLPSGPRPSVAPGTGGVPPDERLQVPSPAAVSCRMPAISDSFSPSSAGIRAIPLAESWSYGPVPSPRVSDATVWRAARLTVAVVFGLIAGWVFLGVPSLVDGWFVQGPEGMHRVHEIGWGLFAVVILGVGVGAYAWSPGGNVAPLQQALLGIGAGGISMFFSGAVVPAHLVRGALVAAPVAGLALLDPDRRRLLRPGRIKPILVGLATVWSVPLLRFAETQLRIQQADRLSPHGTEFHWGTMATLALAIVAIAMLAGLGSPGWRISAWSAGFAMATFGLASALMPNYASSVGRPWGAAAMAAGAVFVGAAEWEAQRAIRSASTSTSA